MKQHKRYRVDRSPTNPERWSVWVCDVRLFDGGFYWRWVRDFDTRWDTRQFIKDEINKLERGE